MIRAALLAGIFAVAACNGDSAPPVRSEAGAQDRGATSDAAREASASGDVALADAPRPDVPPPMCKSSSECAQASVSSPGSTEPPVSTPTSCVGGRCGLVASYSGSYASPKTPRACTEICAASTYGGKPMVCSASCRKKVVNGFGDLALVFDEGGDAGGGPGSLAGLVTYQFSTMSGAYKFVEVSCSQVPQSKLVQGSNSYKYVSHRCCCVAP